MARPEPQNVRRLACIGAGLMGGGWVVHFLAQGLEVHAQDPDPGAGEKLKRLLERAWPRMVDLGLAKGASPDRWKITTKVAEACEGAEFVQESAPERVDLKTKLLAEIDRATDPDIVISSSTSGFVMSAMHGECVRPQRLVVGHPFNPPYLMPLVEVVGGSKTEAWAVDWACKFYDHFGHYAIKMDVEVPGFIANRLQQAIWHEALHMIVNGQATVEQIDAAQRQGPGLRWAMMGQFVLMHLAGGEGGIDHAMDHFGGPPESKYAYLKPPPMTPDLDRKIREGTKKIVGKKSYAELVRDRDKLLVAFRKAIAASEWDKR